MSICFVAPRFYPAIGGVESYLQNIAEYCSNYFDTTVITSNLKNVPHKYSGKYIFIKKKYDIISKNIEIIRANTLNNIILKWLFYLNQYINKEIEIIFDKFLNPELYSNEINKKPNYHKYNRVMRFLINQRLFFNPNFFQIYYILRKINKNYKINIIHSSPLYLTNNICAYKFSRRNQIPFICTPLYHINPFASYIFYPSYQYVLRNSDAVIACTEIEKNFYQKYGIDKNKIHIIPPGINPENYVKKEVEKFKKKNKIPENSPLILFMGRKSYEKGAFNSILSLKYLIKNFKNIRLLLAGPNTREYEIFFNKLPLKIKQHIIDLGIVDKETKINAFASCDVFILPSLDDAFGIVYLEAWLFKKPVIGALKGNVEGLIDNDLNGCLIDFNSVKALALKIEELLNDDKKRKYLGQNGYNKLFNNYLLELTNKKTLELYRKFI